MLYLTQIYLYTYDILNLQKRIVLLALRKKKQFSISDTSKELAFIINLSNHTNEVSTSKH